MSDHRTETWTLHRGDQLVARLVVTGGDFPWLNARVEACDGFAEVRPLFVEELRLMNDADRDGTAWGAQYEAIRRSVTLRYPDGRDVPEFLLHVDGDHAWWRWNDEPFDDADPHT